MPEYGGVSRGFSPDGGCPEKRTPAEKRIKSVAHAGVVWYNMRAQPYEARLCGLRRFCALRSRAIDGTMVYLIRNPAIRGDIPFNTDGGENISARPFG